MQNLLGRCGRSRFVRQTAFPIRGRSFKTAKKTQQLQLQFSQTDFRKSGKPRSRTRHREDYYSPEKFRMECVLEKPVAPLLLSPPPAGQFLPLCSLPSSFSGAGEGIRTPDPLITNQMLYRLSYASNWGKARLRANLSHGSLPDVRDNYIKYHSVKRGRNKSYLCAGSPTRRHPMGARVTAVLRRKGGRPREN